jgi:phage terminase small subunit
MAVRIPLIKKKKGRPIREMTSTFAIKAEVFALEFLKDFNQSAALRRSGYRGSDSLIYNAAQTYMKLPQVREAIERAVIEKRERLQLAADDIARHWFSLATADARELCPVIVGPCRYCYGIDFQYQFTFNEMREARQAHMLKQQRIRVEKERVPFDELGGDGYTTNLEPNKECPECHGYGIMHVKPVDVTKLSVQGALLFDGYKISKDGIVEIKLRDRSRAMENLTELLGLSRKRPIAHHNPDDMTDEELDAVLKMAIQRRIISPEDIRKSDPGLIEQEKV